MRVMKGQSEDYLSYIGSSTFVLYFGHVVYFHWNTYQLGVCSYYKLALNHSNIGVQFGVGVTDYTCVLYYVYHMRCFGFETLFSILSYAKEKISIYSYVTLMMKTQS